MILCTVVGCGEVRDVTGRRTGDATDAAPHMEPSLDGHTTPRPRASPDGSFRTICDGESIRLQAIPDAAPCAWKFPTEPTASVRPDHVNVRYVAEDPGIAEPSLPFVSSPDGCGDSLGWYYDVPENPTMILGCAALCRLADADASPRGYLIAMLGCPRAP